MLSSVDVKFIFDSACLSASLEDKGLFSSANILQTADVVRCVVFLLFLLCFKPKVHLFLPLEVKYWVIPENIHTIPRAASWNSEGEGGFLGLEFRRRGGGG